MPTFIALFNFTDQGIRNVKGSPDRARAAAEQMEKLGVALEQVYWTLGTYDIVAVVEAPDDESATAALLALGSQGNVRSTTLRAFDREEIGSILGKID